MKIHFKRVATTALAVAMSLSLAAPAFAEEVPSGTLTVTGNELAGKNVFAVRMFTAVANENEDSYTFTDYELEDKWLPFFDKIDYSEYNSNNDDDPDIMTPVEAEDALAYMEWLKNGNEQQWAAFAEDAQDWLYKQNFITVSGGPENQEVSIAEAWSGLASMKSATEVQPVEVNEAPSGNATFDSLTSGYYVVFPEGGSTGTDSRGTDAMLINIPTDHAGSTWNIKSTFPTVDKTVDDNNNATGEGNAANGSAQVGDTVTFTLTSAVPDMSDYTSFYFAFNDTLSNGLEFVKAGETAANTDVTVTIGGRKVESNYTVTLQENVLKVEFDNLSLVAGGSDNVGDPIVVTYQAMITESAVVGTPALNTVEVEYSNNPNSTTHGTSTPDESKVYTYAIDVNKWASDAGGKDSSLAGAKFVISTSETLTDVESDENIVKLVGSAQSYRVAKPNEEGAVASFTTTNVDDITISGLEAGTYYLHEIEAPAGYNKLKAPVKIEIVVSEENYENATIKVDGKEIQGNGTIVDVENKKGIELPETGSIGTIGLTVAGVAIVLLGVFAPRKKKKDNQE